MNCERCQGLMVHELIWDPQGLSSGLRANGYRCVLCGDVVDDTILANRQRSTASVGVSAVTSPHKQPLMAA